jgi:hypothetical protein
MNGERTDQMVPKAFLRIKSSHQIRYFDVSKQKISVVYVGSLETYDILKIKKRAMDGKAANIEIATVCKGNITVLTKKMTKIMDLYKHLMDLYKLKPDKAIMFETVIRRITHRIWSKKKGNAEALLLSRLIGLIIPILRGTSNRERTLFDAALYGYITENKAVCSHLSFTSKLVISRVL